MKYPNNLLAMVRACGKSLADLSGELCFDETWAGRYTAGRCRPSKATADRICTVLSEWAEREVPVVAIFPELYYPTYHGQKRQRNEAAIAAILEGKNGY